MKPLTLYLLLLSQASMLSQTAKPLPTGSGFDYKLILDSKELPKEAFHRLREPDLKEFTFPKTTGEPVPEIPEKSTATGNNVPNQQRTGITAPTKPKRLTVAPLDTKEDWAALMRNSPVRVRLTSPDEVIASPSPDSKIVHREDADFAIFEKSAIIQPSRPALSGSLPGVPVTDGLTALAAITAASERPRPTFSPIPSEVRSSLLDTNREKIVIAAGGVTSSAGWQILKLGNDPNTTTYVSSVLKNIGVDEVVAEDVVQVAKTLAASRAGGRFALGLIVVGTGVVVYNLFFGHDGSPQKQGVYIQPEPSRPH